MQEKKFYNTEFFSKQIYVFNTSVIEINTRKCKYFVAILLTLSKKKSWLCEKVIKYL